MSASPDAEELQLLIADLGLEPFAETLQPLIDQALTLHDQGHYQQGALLVPRLLVWFVLMLTLRRD